MGTTPGPVEGAVCISSESHSLLTSVSNVVLHHIAGMIIFWYKVIAKLHITALFEADALVQSFTRTNAQKISSYFLLGNLWTRCPDRLELVLPPQTQFYRAVQLIECDSSAIYECDIA